MATGAREGGGTLGHSCARLAFGMLALACFAFATASSVGPAMAADAPFRLDEALKTPDWLTISGSHRFRYSALENQFRPGLSGGDQAITLRTLLQIEATAGEFSIVGELQDSRAYLSDAGGALSTIDVNPMELLQGYVSLRQEDFLAAGDKIDFRFGRQTLDIGGRRLIARNRFRDAIQTYTGLAAHWTGSDNSEFRAFYLLPVLVRPTDLPSILDNKVRFDEEDFDLRFWGLWWKRQNLIAGAAAEFYLYGLNEDDDPSERQTADRNLYTPGIRLIRSPKRGEFDFDIENVAQFGERRATKSANDTKDLNVFSHFHHAEVGYTFNNAWSLRLSAEFDFASGDDDPADGDYNRFDSLFGPRRSEFGPTGIYGLLGRENILSTGLRLSVKPNRRTDGYVSWRANALDEADDFFARSGVRDPAGASGKFAGNQIEARLRYWLVPDNIRLESGGAIFLNGRFLETAPNITGEGDPRYFYADVEFTF